MSTTKAAVQDQCGEKAVLRMRLVEPVRRRASAAQGHALETLGHAIEYLVDSQLWRAQDYHPKDDQDAIQILMRLSRAVFAECPEVISVRRRLRRWIDRRGAMVDGLG